MVSIVWSGELPSDVQTAETLVRKAVGGLKDCRDLVFDHVFLTEDYEGPCILVTGGANPDEVVCSYHATTEWTERKMTPEDKARLRHRGYNPSDDDGMLTPKIPGQQ